MKKIFLSTIILLSLGNAGLFGETEEEQRNAKEKLRLAMSLQQNPLISKIRKENEYLKKILNEHKINYKLIIKQKKNSKKINKVRNYLYVSEKKEIETLKQINKELRRLLKVNYIELKEPNRNYESGIEKFKKQYRRKTGLNIFSSKNKEEHIVEKNNLNKINERVIAKENLKLEMQNAINDVN